jgi:hypothetical protein
VRPRSTGGAYARLGFDSVNDDVFRSLVLARVVEQTSKADTIWIFGELRRTP